MHCAFPQTNYPGDQRQRRGVPRAMCGGPAADNHSYPSRREVLVVILRIVMQDALSEVVKLYPQLKLNAYVDDMKVHVWAKNQEVLQTVPKVVSKLQSVSKEANFKTCR